jgi:hypothetical protein
MHEFKHDGIRILARRRGRTTVPAKRGGTNGVTTIDIVLEWTEGNSSIRS